MTNSHILSHHIQIISLGAGFDSSYFRLTNSGALSNTRYLEVDMVLLHELFSNDRRLEVSIQIKSKCTVKFDIMFHIIYV